MHLCPTETLYIFNWPHNWHKKRFYTWKKASRSVTIISKKTNKTNARLWAISVTFSSAIKSSLIIQNTLQLQFECGPISRVLKTTTRGAFSEPRHGSQRPVCQITNASSITLTCQKMVVNIAVGRQGWLGNCLKLLGQIGCWTSQSLVVSTHPFKPKNMPYPTRLHSALPLFNMPSGR